MELSKIGLAFTVAVTLAFGAVIGGDAQAAQKEYKPKSTVKVKALKEGPLAGVDGKTVIVKHFTLPAGFVGGKHFHPGPVFVYIEEGTLTVETKEQGKQTFSAGQLYEEPIGRVMQARNLSSDGVLKLVVFQIGETGKPMMIKAK